MCAEVGSLTRVFPNRKVVPRVSSVKPFGKICNLIYKEFLETSEKRVTIGCGKKAIHKRGNTNDLYIFFKWLNFTIGKKQTNL